MARRSNDDKNCNLPMWLDGHLTSRGGGGSETQPDSPSGHPPRSLDFRCGNHEDDKISLSVELFSDRPVHPVGPPWLDELLQDEQLAILYPFHLRRRRR